jgi:hypothetical protein
VAEEGGDSLGLSLRDVDKNIIKKSCFFNKNIHKLDGKNRLNRIVHISNIN